MRVNNIYRKLKSLLNFEPAATAQEILNTAMQYVHKISGVHRPSKTNSKVFDAAVEQISNAWAQLIGALVTDARLKTGKWNCKNAAPELFFICRASDIIFFDFSNKIGYTA